MDRLTHLRTLDAYMGPLHPKPLIHYNIRRGEVNASNGIRVMQPLTQPATSVYSSQKMKYLIEGEQYPGHVSVIPAPPHST